MATATISVTVHDAIGASASSSVVVASVGMPAVPTGLSGTVVTSNSVKLTWNASTGATSYNVYRNSVKIASPTVTTYTDSNLANGQYTYQVSATNSAGTSVMTTGLLWLISATALDPNAIIVSTTGNDSTGTGTLANPVLTFGKAQTLVRVASNTKTVYIRGGTYNLTTGLELTSSDNGETWSCYPPDGYNSAILDYGGMSLTSPSSSNPMGTSLTTAWAFAIIGGNNIIFNGLQIQNFPGGGIVISGGTSGFGWIPNAGTASGNTITNCIFLNGNGGGPPFNTGDGQNANTLFSTEGTAIFCQNTPSTTISHNAIQNMMTTGITTVAGSGGNYSNTVVTGNFLKNCNIAGNDTGGIYFQDTSIASSNVSVTNNYLSDIKSLQTTYNTYPKDVRCIYFDDGASNTMVTGNIITGGLADNTINTTSVVDTEFMCMYGLGANTNLTISGNLLDHGPQFHFCFLNSSTGTGNTFTGNVIISNFSGNPANAAFGANFQNWSNASGTVTAITDTDNQYFNYGGGSVYTTATGVAVKSNDAAPQTGTDPLISGWIYTISTTSVVFGSPVNFPGLPTSWGPPGFAIPQTGTAPSCPH